MTPHEMAEIHVAAMVVPPPWTAPTMKGFLTAPGAVFCPVGKGFALGRVIADEAELLTLAVAPEAQRRGTGRACLDAFETACRESGAVRVFLEVAATNAPARALYMSAGYAQDGLRRGYYRHEGGETIDALLLSKPLLGA